MSTKKAKTATIDIPDREALAAESTGLVQRAETFRVENVDDHNEAQLIFRDLKAAQKKVEEKLDPIIKTAHATHKSLTTLRAEILAPITVGLQAIQRACLAFEDIQRKKAEEEQRRLQALAQKHEEEQALMDAIDAEAAGDKAGATEILSAPVVAPLVEVAPVVAEVKGVTSRVTWSAEVTNLGELVQYVSTRPEWLNLLMPNGPALNKLAQAQKEALKIPGVKAVATRALSARTA